MSKILLQTLGFSAELLSEVSSRFGDAQSVSKQVVSNLKSSSSIKKAFLPKAKNPNLKWGYNKNESSQAINFAFRDGEAVRTRGNFTASQDGRVDYDFTFVNPQTGEQTLSTRGFYNPNQPMFSTKQHGAGYEWNDGCLTIHTHSSGFSNDTTTNKEFLGDVAKQIKEFFCKTFSKERSGQMFFPGESFSKA